MQKYTLTYTHSHIQHEHSDIDTQNIPKTIIIHCFSKTKIFLISTLYYKLPIHL